jgi:Uma2 family endonuclease
MREAMIARASTSLVEIPLTGRRHALTALRIATMLDLFVRERGLGTVCGPGAGFVISGDPEIVRSPDVAFIRRERIAALEDEDGFWPFAPDLVIEVIEPAELYSPVRRRVREWLNAGTRMVFTVDAGGPLVDLHRLNRTGAMLSAKQDDVLEGEDVVPGWQIPVRDIFI